MDKGAWQAVVHRLSQSQTRLKQLSTHAGTLGNVQLCSIHRETQDTQVRSLGQEDPLKEELATHSNILAWRIPWTEEPGWLQSMGAQRV